MARFVDEHSDTTFGLEEQRLDQIEKTYELPVGIATSIARFMNHRGPHHEIFRLDNRSYCHLDFVTGHWIIALDPVTLVYEVYRQVPVLGMDLPNHVIGALYEKVFKKAYGGHIE